MKGVCFPLSFKKFKEETKMTYSRLTYARELIKERKKLQDCWIKEKEKKRLNSKKLELIEITVSEVKKEMKSVSEEIENWLKTADLPLDIVDEAKNYFLKGNNDISYNFFRYIRRALGEN
jgi:hypothetical protein